MQNQKKAYVFAGLTIICWSTVATAFKIALDYQNSFQLLLVSTLVSLSLLFLVILSQGKLKELLTFSSKDYLYSALLGFLNPFLYYLILFKAYSLLPAQVAQPLNMTWPVVLVLISIPLLGQKISFKSILALLISFGGVALISSQGANGNYTPDQLPGILMAVGSSVIWSFFWLLNVKDKRDEPIKLFLNFFFAFIFLLISMPIFKVSFPSGENAWLSATYIGFFEMGLAFIFWLKALQLTSSTDKISNLIYISPFLSLIFIHFILGEKIYITTLVGLILIILGIIVNFKKKNIDHGGSVIY
jgi:drug/metabolite transporter (DMT)-like permease